MTISELLKLDMGEATQWLIDNQHDFDIEKIKQTTGVKTMNVDCPVCGQNIDLDNYDMPDRACDDMDITCENESCEEEFQVGWYATAEVR